MLQKFMPKNTQKTLFLTKSAWASPFNKSMIVRSSDSCMKPDPGIIFLHSTLRSIHLVTCATTAYTRKSRTRQQKKVMMS